MKNNKVKHGFYKECKNSEPKQFLVNNPWPYRGDRWRKIKDWDVLSNLICIHIHYTKNILIGGNTIYTNSDGRDIDISEVN